MGAVVDLCEARRAKLSRAAVAAVMHPSLRWAAGTDTGTAHRRDQSGRAVCGIAGILTVAPRGAELCGACYRT